MEEGHAATQAQEQTVDRETAAAARDPRVLCRRVPLSLLVSDVRGCADSPI